MTRSASGALLAALGLTLLIAFAGCAAGGTDDGAPEPDCSDGQCDEKSADGGARPDCKFLCSTGECLAKGKQCDGVDDCRTGTLEDEHVSFCGPTECKDTEFTCADGTCLTTDKICNATNDCEGGEDELLCGAVCGFTDVVCTDWSCIPPEKRCDGNADCAGGEDELGCERR